MNNSFLDQFAPNIKFDYFCFDRVIIRGCIRHLFFAGGVAILLKVLGFRQMTSGVMRILTDQLNAHIEKVAKQKDIPIHWWPSAGGGTDGAKLDFVKKKYTNAYTGKGDHVYCIITDKESSHTFASRELTSKTGKNFHRLYECIRLQRLLRTRFLFLIVFSQERNLSYSQNAHRKQCGQVKPVKQYYICFHDGLLGGSCYLKICSYLPFQCEFHFNGHTRMEIPPKVVVQRP